ncbi:MAG: GNAT family N-acetyltransferase [Anaerolineae bacterium]|nr:GNAT family N-acetyltransferase [Anaerolineae bacterium]
MNPEITLDQTAQLPAGFSIRPGALDDYKIVFELINASSLSLLGSVDLTDPELIRNDWKDPKFDMTKSTRMIFAPDGTLVGALEVWDTGNPPVHPWIWFCVHPDYADKGIDAILLDWGEARAAQAVERVPDGIRFAPRTGFPVQNVRFKALAESRGYKYDRSFYRMATAFDSEPEVPPISEGIVIRPYNPETEFEAVVRTMIESFRDHYGFVERPFEDELENFRHHFLGDPIYDPSLWFVAMDGDEMVGISVCRAEDYENSEQGFVNELGVRREWRKRGIASALLKTSFAEFYRRGKKGAALGVDANSLTGALKIYERAGMRPARQYDNYEKELRAGEEISTQTV